MSTLRQALCQAFSINPRTEDKIEAGTGRADNPGRRAELGSAMSAFIRACVWPDGSLLPLGPMAVEFSHLLLNIPVEQAF